MIDYDDYESRAEAIDSLAKNINNLQFPNVEGIIPALKALPPAIQAVLAVSKDERGRDIDFDDVTERTEKLSTLAKDLAGYGFRLSTPNGGGR